MKFFRLDLLTLLISLFILNSCKNENTIGLTSGTGTVSGSLIDTATVFANTTNDDTVVTSGITKVPLGYFKDPVMGTTTSDMITDINLPGASVSSNQSYTVPTGKIYIDSAVLKLQYADGFYGDSLTSRYKVNVYQLGQRFYSTQNYYNDSKWTYDNNNLLGAASFYARPHDTLKVINVVNGGPDTAIKVVPQIRVRIDTNFIRNNLFVNAFNQLNSNLLFQNHVKGFYLTMDQNQAGVGGTLMFQAPGDSALEVHIRTVNGNTIDTTVVYLNISQHAASISHVYSAAVNTAKHNTITHNTDSLIYLQGLSSLRAKISFPYIKNLFNSLGNNVVINRAELVVTAAPGSDIPAYLAPQPTLSLYRLDLAHQRVSVEDASTTDPRHYSNGIFGGIYSQTTHQYHFLITSYIQDLIDGATIDYGTYIAPIDNTNTSSVDISATPETAGRTVAVGNPKSSSPLYPYRIKLNVIYTKTNKQ